MDLLSLEQQRDIRKRRKGDPDITRLLKECKRLRTRYVGTELHFMNPIAERTARRVKVDVNRLREEAAHLAVVQGIQEMQAELTKWEQVPVDKLADIPSRLRKALQSRGILWVSEVLRLTETDLLAMDKVTFRDITRLEAALSRLGCER